MLNCYTKSARSGNLATPFMPMWLALPKRYYTDLGGVIVALRFTLVYQHELKLARGQNRIYKMHPCVQRLLKKIIIIKPLLNGYISGKKHFF